MSNFYKTKEWNNLRKKILRRDRYECQYFRRFGRSVDATTVHHIFPYEFYPELKKVSWNLISLSHEAHNMMHDRLTHKLTDEGKSLRDRYLPKYFEYCRKKNIEPRL